MREPTTIETAVLNGDSAHGGVRGVSASGFTAVNGTGQRSTSFRPEGPVTAAITLSEGHPVRTPTTQPQFNSHNWRPDDRSHFTKQSQQDHTPLLTSGKRKREEEETNSVNTDATFTGENPPAKRLTITLDSAVDLTSPDKLNQPATASPMDLRPSSPSPSSTYHREKSPVARWNQGEPPPRPRPETEAELAASLHQFQSEQAKEAEQARQAQLAREPPSVADASPESATPPNGADGQQHSPGGADDEHLQGDGADARKRKRNFSNRTKTGCHTCRSRKKKCDEAKPTCQNCDRGGFVCTGYGPKPPNTKVIGQRPVALQSKPAYEPPRPATGQWQQPRADEGRSYSHWGRINPEPEPPRQYPHPPPPPPVNIPIDTRRPSTSDQWQKPAWPPTEPQPPPYERLPPPNFTPIPPPHPYPPPTHQPPPPMQQPPPPPPPPIQVEPLPHPGAGPYSGMYSGVPTPLSARDSLGAGPPHFSSHFSMGYPRSSQYNEKEKMLRGLPCFYYLDNVLGAERRQCKAAVERYNEAADTRSAISSSERAKKFTEILVPHKRHEARSLEPGWGPVGSIDDHTVVETPFHCEYGYNIHLGKDTIIEKGCCFYDAADITIGDRCIVGPHTKFQCLVADPNPAKRKGSQGEFTAGAIHVENDVLIGCDVVIHAFVKIGRGAVVESNSVVTKVCFILPFPLPVRFTSSFASLPSLFD